MPNLDPIDPAYAIACRALVASTAAPLAGLSDAPATKAQYLACIAPPGLEGDALSEEMGTMWSCALTTLGLWRMLGVQHKLLQTPYVVGQAMAWVQQIAYDFKAWNDGDSNNPNTFDVGDAVLVRAGQHVVAAIVSKTPTSPYFYDTVEGGQITAAGLKSIERYYNKSYTRTAAGIFLGSSKVYGWVDCTRLGLNVIASWTPDPHT